jgi:micrococcal nuclease
VRPLLAVAVLSLLAAACSFDTASGASLATIPDHEHGESNAIVERVVDGDTIVIDIIGSHERVRLLRIDTPESVAVNRPEDCYGKESAAYLTSLLPKGTEVTLVRGVESRDQYDQLFVNLDLLKRGYAGVMIYEPNSFFRKLFEDAEKDAFEAGIGLWGMCGGPDVPLG